MIDRDRALEIFGALYDAGFDVQLNARRDPKFQPTEAFPIRVTARPCDGDQLRKLEETLEPLGLDYRADSLTATFSNGVTFNVFERGARSYPV